MTGRRGTPAAGVLAAVVVSSAGAWLLGQRDGRRECASLRERAERDPLTGLLNRAGLYTAAGSVLASAGVGRAGALLLDLDGFKPVNDAYGHAAGDRILVEAADRLAGVVGSRGVVARLGGDEFAVLLPGLPPGEPAAIEAAVEVGRAIAAALADPYGVDGQSLRVGASVGAATAVAPFVLAGLLADADLAMYAVKRAGGGVGAAPAAEPGPAAAGGWVPAPRRSPERLRDRAAGSRAGIGVAR
jgi:diguanylate cyclase (GGDEF)-like protein